MIGTLARAGQDIILSTHGMGFARAVADRVAFVAAGAVAETGPPARVPDAPAGWKLDAYKTWNLTKSIQQMP